MYEIVNSPHFQEIFRNAQNPAQCPAEEAIAFERTLGGILSIFLNLYFHFSDLPPFLICLISILNFVSVSLDLGGGGG